MQFATDVAPKPRPPGYDPASSSSSASSPFSEFKVVRRNDAVAGFEPSKISIAMTKMRTLVQAACCGLGERIVLRPVTQSLFVKSNLSGAFTVVNAYLMCDLEGLGLREGVMIADPKYFDDGLVRVDRATADLRRRPQRGSRREWRRTEVLRARQSRMRGVPTSASRSAEVKRKTRPRPQPHPQERHRCAVRGCGQYLPWMSEITDLKRERNFFETCAVEYQTGRALSWD